jgi:hypothetical protein
MMAFLLGYGRPRREQVRRWAVLVLTLGVVVLLAALSRVLQPELRGVGGVNTLGEMSKVPLDSLDDGALTGFTTSMAPFTGLVWAPLAGPYLFAVSAAVTGLAWGLALQVRLPRPGQLDRADSDALGPGAGAFPVLALALAWLVPAVLVVLTWLSTRVIPVQQRYYMATATLLLVLGAATTPNRWVRWLAAGVMALSTGMVVRALVVT